MRMIGWLTLPRLRLRVGAKFSLAVGLLLPAFLVVAVLGSFGLSRLNTKVQTLYADNQLHPAHR